jgi:hypothetical protein
LNAKANYNFSNHNKLYVSGYFGRDKFYANSTENESVQKNGLYWQNATTTVRWNHLFNNQIFANTSAIFSDYTLKLYSEEKFAGDLYTLCYKSGIQDFTGKFDLQFIPNPNHLVRAGLSTIYHVFTPIAFVVKSVYNDDIDQSIKNEALESGLYLEDDWKTPWKLKVNGGLRLSSFVTGTKTYINPEPRISASYPLKNNLSIKASFASMSQYLHLLSNTGVGLPTDLWVPATNHIAPQQSWQIAGGLAKDFSKKDISVTIEGYYKKSEHIIGYREGSSFLMIDNPSSTEEFDWEKNVTSGQAWSYGAELMVRKNVGKLTGWIGYTLSWTQMQFDELNFGKKFYARYDRRHDISVVAMYNFTPDITMSATWVYGTGNAVTLPKASYMPMPYGSGNNYYFGTITDYGDKNSYRMAAYHRLDIGVQFHKKRTKYERTIEFGLYNAYNRKNPFYIYLTSKYYNNGTQKQILKQVSIFPLIPSISWSIKF